MNHVIDIEEMNFYEVDWGVTKELICPKSVGSKNTLVKLTKYLPGHTHLPHVHQNQEETIYVLSGKGISEVNGNRMEIYPGKIAFVPAGAEHQTINLSKKESLEAIIIKSPPDNL